MAILTKKTMEYLDWHDIAAAVLERTGKDLRDWAGKYRKVGVDYDENVPYQDFWHTICDDIAGNGAMEPFWFDEMLENAREDDEIERWRIECLEAIVDVVGPGCNMIHFSW